VWSHEVIVGPATRQIEVPLERVPLYARGNALLPTMEPVEHLAEAPWDFVTFDAYLLDRGQAMLRDLDGMTHISAALDGVSLDLRLSGARSRVGLRLLPVAGHGVQEVRLNGTPLPQRDTLTLDNVEKTGWSVQADHTVTALLVA
jgi:alpha-glucosidase (family GH31 glycosyl hydrolase)